MRWLWVSISPRPHRCAGQVGYYCARHERGGSDHRAWFGGPGLRREHDVRRGPHGGRRQPVCGSNRSGGLLVIKGNASSRCGISMKGVDIVVHGNVGHMSAFMAQSGNLLVSATRATLLATRFMKLIVRARQGQEPRSGLHREGKCGPNTCRNLPHSSKGGGDGRETARIQALWLGAEALQLQYRQR